MKIAIYLRDINLLRIIEKMLCKIMKIIQGKYLEKRRIKNRIRIVKKSFCQGCIILKKNLNLSLGIWKIAINLS